MVTHLIRALGVFIAALGMLDAYLKVSMMGFPDGHLTEFDRVLRPLLWAHGAGCGIAALLSVRHRTPWAGLLFWGLLTMLLWLWTQWGMGHLEHGQGG